MDEDTNIEAGGDEGGDKSVSVEFPKWMSSLPDAYKTDARFSTFEEPAKAWDKFATLLDAEGKVIAIPDEKATDEDRASFFTKLGRPEKAEGYSIKKPDSLPDELYSPEVEAAYRTFAHKEGLSDKQASGIYSWYYGLVASETAKSKEAIDKTINSLKDEWKGDDYKKNVELAHRAFNEFSNDDVAEFIDKTMADGVSLGNHPVFLKLFANIAKSIMDDSATGDRGGSGGGEPDDEAKAQSRFPKTKFKK